MIDTYFGFVIEQKIMPIVGYTVEIDADLGVVQAVTGVNIINNGGTADATTTTSAVLGSIFSEATVDFMPMDSLKIRLGEMFVPFQLDVLSVLSYNLLPTRAGPTSYFLPGLTDWGAMAQYKPFGDYFSIRAGVFNGNGVSIGTAKDQGLLLLLRADVAPMGVVPSSVDLEHGSPRVAIGYGLGYYPSEVFDSSGYVSTHASDLRMDASLKFAWQGFVFQGEYMFRQRTDSVTASVTQDSGWYAQGSYYVRASPKWGFAPVFRYGTVSSDTTFIPQVARWLEAGLAFYLLKEKSYSSRIMVQYLGEFLPTEGDTAHGVNMSYLALF